jgi:hypothetical protein
MQKIALTHSRSSRERYYLISGYMGNLGKSYNHVNNHFKIANGIDKGNGYQGYMAVSYFLKQDSIPQSVKDMIIKICKEKGYTY